MKYTFEESDIKNGLTFIYGKEEVLYLLVSAQDHIQKYIIFDINNNIVYDKLRVKELLVWINGSKSVPVITQTNIIG